MLPAVRAAEDAAHAGEGSYWGAEEGVQRERDAGGRHPEGGHDEDRQDQLHLPPDRLRGEDEEEELQGHQEKEGVIWWYFNDVWIDVLTV